MVLPPPEDEDDQPKEFKIILKRVSDGDRISYEQIPDEEEEEVKKEAPSFRSRIWRRKSSYNKDRDGSSI